MFISNSEFEENICEISSHLLAVVSFVTNSCTFCAAAQRPQQSARATLEYVLINVLSTSPRETTRIVAAQQVNG